MGLDVGSGIDCMRLGVGRAWLDALEVCSLWTLRLLVGSVLLFQWQVFSL